MFIQVCQDRVPDTRRRQAPRGHMQNLDLRRGRPIACACPGKRTRSLHHPARRPQRCATCPRWPWGSGHVRRVSMHKGAHGAMWEREHACRDSADTACWLAKEHKPVDKTAALDRPSDHAAPVAHAPLLLAQPSHPPCPHSPCDLPRGHCATPRSLTVSACLSRLSLSKSLAVNPQAPYEEEPI